MCFIVYCPQQSTILVTIVCASKIILKSACHCFLFSQCQTISKSLRVIEQLNGLEGFDGKEGDGHGRGGGVSPLDRTKFF